MNPYVFLNLPQDQKGWLWFKPFLYSTFTILELD